MANFDAPKRKISQSFEGHSSKITRPTHLSSEMISSQGKRRRLTSEILENESSTDSYSNSNILLSESEGSGSDSDFEEHSYSRSVTSSVDTSNVDLVRVFDKTNRPMNSRPRGRPKSNLSLKMSQWEKSCQENGKRRSKCTSKNAMNARLNRLKKKQYIENLENRNAKLESEKQSLKSMLGTKIKEVESLKRRTLYLESVIKNESEIASVLRCVRQHTGLEVTSSLLRPSTQHRNSPVPEDHTQAEKPSTNTHSGLETPQPTEEEGNDALSFGSLRSPWGFLDKSEEAQLDFEISNHPILPDVDSWFNPSQFDFPESPESTGYGGSISPLRCETPSKGFTSSENKDNLGVLSDAGICFHIANKKVSLEFCDSCNQMASL